MRACICLVYVNDDRRQENSRWTLSLRTCLGSAQRRGIPFSRVVKIRRASKPGALPHKVENGPQTLNRCRVLIDKNVREHQHVPIEARSLHGEAASIVGQKLDLANADNGEHDDDCSGIAKTSEFDADLGDEIIDIVFVCNRRQLWSWSITIAAQNPSKLYAAGTKHLNVHAVQCSVGVHYRAQVATHDGLGS